MGDLFRGRNQWILLAVVVVGFFLYRSIVGGSGPLAQDMKQRQEDVRNFWFRIPGYPGAGTPEGAQIAENSQLVSDRLYPAKATYEQAKSFYENELTAVGWKLIGEQKSVAGFTSPVRVYRNGDYHLLLSTGPRGIRIRITFSPDLDPLLEKKLLTD